MPRLQYGRATDMCQVLQHKNVTQFPSHSRRNRPTAPGPGKNADSDRHALSTRLEPSCKPASQPAGHACRSTFQPVTGTGSRPPGRTPSNPCRTGASLLIPQEPCYNPQQPKDTQNCVAALRKTRKSELVNRNMLRIPRGRLPHGLWRGLVGVKAPRHRRHGHVVHGQALRAHSTFPYQLLRL